MREKNCQENQMSFIFPLNVLMLVWPPIVRFDESNKFLSSLKVAAKDWPVLGVSHSSYESLWASKLNILLFPDVRKIEIPIKHQLFVEQLLFV